MKQVIFTICAKNYLAQAKTLGYSIKKFCSNCDFFILLSDEVDGNNLLSEDFEVIEARTIGIDEYYNMAFKYDVIEFSTAVKPFYINKLLSIYDKVLFLDPDMVVYHSLQFLFDNLDNYDALLTPHLLKPYINYEGATSEESLLWVGTFNLGFFGIKASDTGRQLIKWWMEKLKNQCYADKEDGLHVDQKWMDFLPSLYGEKVLVIRNPAVNIAFWNYHERKFYKEDGQYFVDCKDYPLAIFHFSSYDPDNIECVAKRQNKFTLTSTPEYREIYENYLSDLKLNGLERLVKLKYKYNEFDNGANILKLHRRLYRGLVEEGYAFTNLFSTQTNTYYTLLLKNHIKLIDKQNKLNSLKKTFGENPPIFNKIFKVLTLINRLFGTNKYYLMMRFFSIYNRFENQTYLIKDKTFVK